MDFCPDRAKNPCPAKYSYRESVVVEQENIPILPCGIIGVNATITSLTKPISVPLVWWSPMLVDYGTRNPSSLFRARIKFKSSVTHMELSVERKGYSPINIPSDLVFDVKDQKTMRVSKHGFLLRDDDCKYTTKKALRAVGRRGNKAPYYYQDDCPFLQVHWNLKGCAVTVLDFGDDIYKVFSKKGEYFLFRVCYPLKDTLPQH